LTIPPVEGDSAIPIEVKHVSVSVSLPASILAFPIGERIESKDDSISAQVNYKGETTLLPKAPPILPLERL